MALSNALNALLRRQVLDASWLLRAEDERGETSGRMVALGWDPVYTYMQGGLGKVQ
jgi:hypothetical protein